MFFIKYFPVEFCLNILHSGKAQFRSNLFGMGIFDAEAVSLESSAIILSLLLIRRIRLRQRASSAVRTLTTIVLASCLTAIGFLRSSDSPTDLKVLFGIFVALCSLLWVVHELFPHASITIAEPCGSDFRQRSGKDTSTSSISDSSDTTSEGEELIKEQEEQPSEEDEPQEKHGKPMRIEEKPTDDTRSKGNISLLNRSGQRDAGKGKRGILLRGMKALGLGDKVGKRREGKPGIATHKTTAKPSVTDPGYPCGIPLCPTGMAKTLKSQINRAKLCSCEPCENAPYLPSLKNGKDVLLEKVTNCLPQCDNGYNEMAEVGDFDLLSTNDAVRCNKPKDLLDSLANLHPRNCCNQESDPEEEPGKTRGQPFCKSLVAALTWPFKCITDYISPSTARIGPLLSRGNEEGDSRVETHDTDSHTKDFFVNLACGLAMNDTVCLLLSGSVFLLLLMLSVIPFITDQ